MDKAKLGLLATLLLGIFILLGALLALLVKKKDKVADFSIGLALGVIGMLIVTDLLPEIVENLKLNHIYIFIICTVIGYFLLKLLDHFIPDHEEEKMDKKERKENLIHIGIITSLALVLHNIIEGSAVYSTFLTDNNLGVGVALGVGFHNIPLGMVIAATFYQSNENIWKTLSIIGLVSLSTFLGGLLMFFLNLNIISPLLLGTLLSLTLGMLLFIAISELLPRMKKSTDKKVSYVGLTIGIVLLLLSQLI